MLLRFLMRISIVASLAVCGGCTLIVASELDSKDDQGTDGDSDADGDCSLSAANWPGREAREVDFPGGAESKAVLAQPGVDIQEAGANLVLASYWVGAGHGYEVQLFNEAWQDRTAHNRVTTITEGDPVSKPAVSSSEDDVYVTHVLPNVDGGSDVVRVTMTYEVVEEEIAEVARDGVLGHPTPITDLVTVFTGERLFYLFSSAEPEASVFAAIGPPDSSATGTEALNPGAGTHLSPGGAWNERSESLLFVFERRNLTGADVLYGLIDADLELVKAPALAAPVGGRATGPVVASADDVGIVAYSHGRATDPLAVRYQIVDFEDGALLLESPATATAGAGDTHAVSVAYHSRLDEFGLAWIEQDEGGSRAVRAARVDLDGVLIQQPTTVSTRVAEGDVTSTSIAPVTFGYAVSWDGPDSVIGAGWFGCVPEDQN